MTLTERLRVALGGVVRPAGVEYEADRLTEVVAEWLRELADATHGTPSMDNDLRHDLAVVGGELASLADRVQAGEA